jgi:hypothetical protein
MQIVLHLDPGSRKVWILDSLVDVDASKGKSQYPEHKKGERAVPDSLEMVVESSLKFLQLAYQLHYPTAPLPEQLQVSSQVLR